ncbi:hypothetical protein [Guptibacillus hwajinpoensis]|uniref:Uncharacterized protein n=1 Tax=Guptibacillus hwajinpoensis TaxID=208199 RepID=A0A0J6D423_9BACL|nr:hypothetical protein [Alkalihalobacillus macyae]KMM39054.1 hypothetical protein AB986_07425 [Alkalihalobacillus macyae]MDP4550592.1 hypothetical protein [Alkalihalobacillus macyae]
MEDNVMKETTEKLGQSEVKIEGLTDGYRITVKGNEEELKQKRRVGGAFINLLKQLEKAGYRLPFPFSWILRFWNRYSRP